MDDPELDAEPVHDRGGARVHEQSRARVRFEDGAQAFRLEVIGVLVGDEDGVQFAFAFEAGREHARVDEETRAFGLQQHAGVSEVDDPHQTAPSAGGP